MKPLETLSVLVFMGPLCLVGLSFIVYTVYSIFEKVVERRGTVV